MGIGDYVSNMLGVTSKAIIEIYDLRDREVKEEDMEKLKSADNPMAKDTLKNAYAAQEFAGTIAEKKKSLEDAAKNLADGKVPGVSEEDVITQFVSSGVKRQFSVMFNPSEIRLGGYGGGKFPTTVFEDGVDINTDKRSAFLLESQARITFSTKLIFDKTNPSQAFYSDRLTLNATRVERFAVDMIKSKALDMDTGSSVQKEVEAFVAALRDPGTRLIKFIWGDMNYEGVLYQVNAEYSMFNINGQPCRGVVDLSILLADDRAYKGSCDLFSQKYEKYWSKSVTDVKDTIKKGAAAINGKV